MSREELIQQIEKFNPNIILVADGMSDVQLNETFQAYQYPQRRKDGQAFSDMQGAKLILLDAPDNVKKEISEFFAQSQNFLVLGWWKSALRDLQAREPNPYVSEELLNGIIAHIQSYIAQSY